MEFRPLAIPGLVEIVPEKFADARGFLSETWSRRAFAAAGIAVDFVQENHSHSEPPLVLRGLHLQRAPHAQAKLVRVVRGRVFDVAVDLRRGSQSFGKWLGLELSAARWNQLYIPEGFAHGFLTLEAGTEVMYKVSAPHAPESEVAIRHDDPDIAIAWPLAGRTPILSERDRAAPPLATVIGLAGLG